MSPRSLCVLLPAPATSWTFTTLFCESFLRCMSPYPGGRLPSDCRINECAKCVITGQTHRQQRYLARNLLRQPKRINQSLSEVARP